MSDDNLVTNAEEANEQAPEIELGRRLRQARESKKLTTSAVADSLHLPKRIIDALEAGNFDKHPGVTFMRGYLRSYVRLLELPANEVMSAFEQINFAERVPQVTLKPHIYQKSKSMAERSLRWVTLMIALVMLALVIVWWRSHGYTDDSLSHKNLLPVATKNTLQAIPTKVSIEQSIDDSSPTTAAGTTPVKNTVPASADTASSTEKVQHHVKTQPKNIVTHHHRSAVSNDDSESHLF